MKNLALHYSIKTYVADRQNGKTYAIFHTGWHLLPEQARLHPYITLPTPSSVLNMQFQTTTTVTTLHIAESTRVLQNYRLLDTLPMTGHVSSQNSLI